MSAHTAARTNVRWPLDPLLAATGHPPANQLATRIGVNVRTIWRWHHNGLTCQQADRAAIALNYHPANIWPTWHHADRT